MRQCGTERKPTGQNVSGAAGGRAALAQHTHVKLSLQPDDEGTSLPVRTAPAAAPPPPLASNMDREFILRNQIVDRYLANKLPAKGAFDFERFCKAHPEILEELQVNERVNAGVRLMEAAGASLPWEVLEKRFWEQLPVFIALAVLSVAGLATALVFQSRHGSDLATIASLQRRVATQPLDPVESSRSLKIELNREGPLGAASYVIADRRAELAELKFQLGWSSFALYRLTVDRVGQGRALVLNNLQRDSNGEVRVALNTHLFGPGDYQLQLEGLNLRGEPTPQGWTKLTFTH